MNEPLSPEIDVQSVKRLIDAGDEFLLLDCREQAEHDVARIDAATLLPMSELMVRVGELDPYKSSHVVVHCHHGGRSLQVAQWLQHQGFSRVQNMTGGIDAWSQAVDPSVPRY